jgi:hypothetical protein
MPDRTKSLETMHQTQAAPIHTPSRLRSSAVPPSPLGVDTPMQHAGNLAVQQSKRTDMLSPSVRQVPSAPILQRQAAEAGPATVPTGVAATLGGSSGPSLSSSTRTPMGPAFGTDVGGVRVHTGPQADRAARDINAKAFTTGRNIYFAASQHQPGTQPSDKPLAHELTHTVQQGSGANAPQTASVISQPGEPLSLAARQD